MKHRNPFAVVVFSIITFGIYALVWEVKTKNEMNRLGAKIPTAWLLIVPLVNVWWIWKYSEGVEKVTSDKLSGVMSFVLLFLLSVIGMAIVQSEFNKVSMAPADVAPVAPGAADTTVGQTVTSGYSQPVGQPPLPQSPTQPNPQNPNYPNSNPPAAPLVQ